MAGSFKKTLYGARTLASNELIELFDNFAADRLGSDPRFVQVILPAVAHHVFGRPFYRPIFEAAQRNDLVVAFHQSGGSRTAVGLPPYYIEWHTAISQAWQSQLIGLIAGGVFDEFEELKVAMIESSWTWVPHLMWRFDYNYRSLRREVPWVRRLPSEYIRERVSSPRSPWSTRRTRATSTGCSR